MADLPDADYTLADALGELRTAGFGVDFSVDDSHLRCGSCGKRGNPREARIERTVRFEGVSDPDDEAILFGLVCSHCGARGVLVAAYGPLASPEEDDVMRALTDTR